MTFLEQVLASEDENGQLEKDLAEIRIGFSERDREVFKRGWMMRASHHLASNRLKEITNEFFKELDKFQGNWLEEDLRALLNWWPIRVFKKHERENLLNLLKALE